MAGGDGKGMRKLSVVIPVYNGSQTIRALVDTVLEELRDLDPEIVLVNDGSHDDSEAVCEGIAGTHPAVKFVSLRRNFGEHNAVMCGLNHMDAEYAAIIDDDFQNPPSEIRKLLAEAEKGYDVVYSRYAQKRHNWFRNAGSRFHNAMATVLLHKPPDLYLSSFKVIRREVVAEIVKYRGPFPYVDGLLLRVTNNISTVLVRHDARVEGRSNYTLGKLISLTMNMFLNYSIWPLRALTILGFVFLAIGLVSSVVFICEKILHPGIQIGWTSLMVAVLTLSGLQLTFLGLIGEYLGKTYLDRNGTPQWVVRKRVPQDAAGVGKPE